MCNSYPYFRLRLKRYLRGKKKQNENSAVGGGCRIFENAPGRAATPRQAWANSRCKTSKTLGVYPRGSGRISAFHLSYSTASAAK